jgi:hypothetical protein
MRLYRHYLDQYDIVPTLFRSVGDCTDIIYISMMLYRHYLDQYEIVPTLFRPVGDCTYII